MDWDATAVCLSLAGDAVRLLRRNIEVETRELLPLECVRTEWVRMNRHQENLHCLIERVPREWEPEQLWMVIPFAVHEGKLYAYSDEWDYLDEEQREGLLATLPERPSGETILVERWLELEDLH